MTKTAASASAWKCRTIAGTATMSMVELRPTKNAVSDTAPSARDGDTRGVDAATWKADLHESTSEPDMAGIA
jgi:hypothetical protein